MRRGPGTLRGPCRYHVRRRPFQGRVHLLTVLMATASQNADARSAVLHRFSLPTNSASCRPKTHYSLWNLIHSIECNSGHKCYYVGLIIISNILLAGGRTTGRGQAHEREGYTVSQGVCPQHRLYLPRRGFKTNDALKKAASDGPIEMGTPPRAYVRSALSAWV